MRIDRLRGAVPADLLTSPWGPGNRYSRDEYEQGTTASTEGLVTAPEVVTGRLVAPLLRGLGVAQQYLPYRPAGVAG